MHLDGGGLGRAPFPPQLILWPWLFGDLYLRVHLLHMLYQRPGHLPPVELPIAESASDERMRVVGQRMLLVGYLGRKYHPTPVAGDRLCYLVWSHFCKRREKVSDGIPCVVHTGTNCKSS